MRFISVGFSTKLAHVSWSSCLHTSQKAIKPEVLHVAVTCILQQITLCLSNSVYHEQGTKEIRGLSFSQQC